MTKEAFKEVLIASILDKSKGRLTIEDIQDTDTLDGLGLDSLDTVEIIIDIERECNTSIPDEDTEGIRYNPISEVVDYLYKYTRHG